MYIDRYFIHLQGEITFFLIAEKSEKKQGAHGAAGKAATKPEQKPGVFSG